MSKTMLGLEEIQAQSVLELPSRETMLVFIVIGDVLSGNEIRIPVRNNNVAAQVCAAVQLVTALTGQQLTCTVEQRQ